jgi:hypothetical protein
MSIDAQGDVHIDRPWFAPLMPCSALIKRAAHHNNAAQKGLPTAALHRASKAEARAVTTSERPNRPSHQPREMREAPPG